MNSSGTLTLTGSNTTAADADQQRHDYRRFNRAGQRCDAEKRCPPGRADTCLRRRVSPPSPTTHGPRRAAAHAQHRHRLPTSSATSTCTTALHRWRAGSIKVSWPALVMSVVRRLRSRRSHDHFCKPCGGVISASAAPVLPLPRFTSAKPARAASTADRDRHSHLRKIPAPSGTIFGSSPRELLRSMGAGAVASFAGLDLAGTGGVRPSISKTASSGQPFVSPTAVHRPPLTFNFSGTLQPLNGWSCQHGPARIRPQTSR